MPQRRSLSHATLASKQLTILLSRVYMVLVKVFPSYFHACTLLRNILLVLYNGIPLLLLHPSRCILCFLSYVVLTKTWRFQLNKLSTSVYNNNNNNSSNSSNKNHEHVCFLHFIVCISKIFQSHGYSRYFTFFNSEVGIFPTLIITTAYSSESEPNSVDTGTAQPSSNCF